MRRESLAISPLQAFKLIAATLLLAVAFGTLYQVAGGHLSPAWLAAAVVHSLLAGAVVAVVVRRRELRPLLSIDSWPPYLAAGFVLVGAALLATATRLAGGAPSAPAVVFQPAWILWIPLVEELVFRVGIGAALRRIGPVTWGIWFSALVFALAHSAPTFERMIAGQVGVPLGPFALALICEGLYLKTGRLLPIVALHAACNATPLVFGVIDARWLDWLGFLYQ